MKTKKDYCFYLKRFQETICFLTVCSIKKEFKTLDAYKAAKNSSKAYCLNIKAEPLSRLSRLPHGKRCFEEFIKSSKKLFTYHRHCHKTFKENKKFSRNSWFELSETTLAKWFEDEKNFNTKTCTLISKTTHKWIDKNVFHYYKGKKMIDNSDIPEEDGQPSIGITKEWLQAEINKQHCSRWFAKNCWRILTEEDEDFKEGRFGWSTEDSHRTKEWRKNFISSLYGKIEGEKFVELTKISGIV